MRKREKYAQVQVLYTRNAKAHKIKKRQQQGNAKDIGALRQKTLYHRDQEDHKMR